MSKQVVVCGWRNCNVELTDSHYCTPSHKNKARAARNKKPPTHEQVEEHARKSTGFSFAKMMETAEWIADVRGGDAGEYKTIMVREMQKRIDTYFAELDA